MNNLRFAVNIALVTRSKPELAYTGYQNKLVKLVEQLLLHVCIRVPKSLAQITNAN